ncbi:hypothetical protein GE09DRAFT_1268524 [Coniochaeta sp. 2T2.1]|nr:hypothetical protein GE09DRAFT_1268524 [Coniochaeta sp. 2T2.1]
MTALVSGRPAPSTPEINTGSNSVQSSNLTKTIEKTKFDESWFQKLVNTWLKCCLEAGGSWDHRTIPLARALEMIYELKPHQKGSLSRNAGNVYQAGVSMAVFSKDVVEMLGFAQLSYAFEKGYIPDTDKGRPDRGREYVMACKNLAVAHASNGNLPDALNMLRKALAAHEERFEREFSIPDGSDTRYKRDEFEIRYHIYMVEGFMACKGLVKHKEAEESYRKAEELIREPFTETETTEVMEAESSTTTEAKTTEGKTAKEKIPAWKSFGTKMMKKKTTGGSSTEGEGTVVVNKDTMHPNERLMRETQLNYARATCILADLGNNNFDDGTSEQKLAQCYEHYTKARHAMQDLKLNDNNHRWTAMCDIQLGLLESRYPHLNSRPKAGL